MSETLAVEDGLSTGDCDCCAEAVTDAPSHYRYLSFNSPLSCERANRIAQRLASEQPRWCLDIGCGWGELMLRVLARSPGTTGLGVDNDQRVLTRARKVAAARDLESRATFTSELPQLNDTAADVVICVGSSHALGPSPAVAIKRLGQLVSPGGRLLLGESFWEPRGPVDTSLVWDDLPQLPDLAGLVQLTVDAGFRPIHIETATVNEWEAFECGYLLDLEAWLLANPDHPNAAKTRAEADEHRTRWLRGYRNALGFAYLTLGVPD